MAHPLLNLPPLDALRGFVAAARRLSITAAAHDLCLTQSAVSRQIQALEERLGTPLFVRGKRTITLTAAGQQLFDLLRPGWTSWPTSPLP
jgi:LysR family transcriptional regulator, glycine cleavage system transcriptional activator